MAERTHKATEDRGLHTFRTEIPNTVVRGIKSRGLSIYAKWLYVYLKSVVGDDGEGFRSTTTIANEAGMSRGQVSAAKHELVKHGLITIKPGRNPHRNPDLVRIKNIWVMNFQEFSVHDANTMDNEEEQELQRVVTASVHTTNTRDITSVQEVNSLHDDEVHEEQGDKAIGVQDMNTTPCQCSPHEHSVQDMNTSVHNMNKRRSLEEDLSEKETDPPIVPPGGQSKRSRTKASQQPNTDYTPGFNKAWALYPRKEKKVDTFTIWRERGLEARAAEIAQKLARLKLTLWKHKEMQYIPLPTTWFNESRYEDDLIPLDIAQDVELRDRTTSREYNNLMAVKRWQEEKFGPQRSSTVSGDDGEVIDGVSYRIE